MAKIQNVKRKDLLYPELSYIIVGSAFDVGNELGSGHNEKYYQKALAAAFYRRGLRFREQVCCPLVYAGKVVGRIFLDFLVEDKIIVEIKKGNRFSKSNIDQVLEYLKTNDLNLAILINFGAEGVIPRRIINIK